LAGASGKPQRPGGKKEIMVNRHLLTRRLKIIFLLTMCLGPSACAQKPAEATRPAQTASDAPIPGKEPPSVGPGPVLPFNSARAMQYVKEIVAFGPRPVGSANHKKVEDYIAAHLSGDMVEADIFTASTPEGSLPVHNLVAKFPGMRDGIIVLASHYDTNYPLRNTSYVGANDGASSSALLLEIANQLRVASKGKPRPGYSVWLVWDDAEEATKQWSQDDSLYGIRHLADKWQADGTLKKIKAFLLADMIGDADLNVDRDQNSTPWLEDMVYQAATQLGYQSHFYARTIDVDDDHRPFLRRGVPCADLIDFDYGYENVFWHTPQDTVDKLSPKSLEIVGSVILQTIQILDAK
jgi:glutaminyl-peptide cyclotransferase